MTWLLWSLRSSLSISLNSSRSNISCSSSSSGNSSRNSNKCRRRSVSNTSNTTSNNSNNQNASMVSPLEQLRRGLVEGIRNIRSNTITSSSNNSNNGNNIVLRPYGPLCQTSINSQYEERQIYHEYKTHPISSAFAFSYHHQQPHHTNLSQLYFMHIQTTYTSRSYHSIRVSVHLCI